MSSVGGLVGRHRSVWAARLVVGGQTVTVVGRGVDPGSVRLGQVTDLGPYLRGRTDMLGRLAERRRQQPPPVLEPAGGVAAYRALAEAALESQLRLLGSLRAGRSPRHRAGEAVIMHAIWQRAVREQELISGSGQREADEIVTLAVNHLTHLQDYAPWFAAEPRLREAAIDETLRHAVTGEDVRSKPAQQAWGVLGDAPISGGPGVQPGPSRSRRGRRCARNCLAASVGALGARLNSSLSRSPLLGDTAAA